MSFKKVNQMLSILFLLFVISSCSTSELKQQVETEKTTDKAQKGTLTNEKLRNDVMQDLVRAFKCQKIEHVQPLVTKKPTGDVGAKSWQEVWLVLGCGKSYSVTLFFKEENSGVSYEIKAKLNEG